MDGSTAQCLADLAATSSASSALHVASARAARRDSMAGEGVLRWLCVRPGRRRRRAARLVLWGGEARLVEPGRAAGEVMLEHAGRVVCRADGFRIGRPAPALAIEDRLEDGRTYVVIPVDRLPRGRDALTAASLAALAYDRGGGGGGGAKSSGSGAPSLAGGARSPFEYVKEDDGRTVIRVTQEFIVRAVTAAGSRKQRPRGGSGDCGGDDGGADGCGALCSTPELRKHYEQLVGAGRGRPWSPRLDTIKERKGRRAMDVVSPGRLSPARLLGLDKGGA